MNDCSNSLSASDGFPPLGFARTDYRGDRLAGGKSIQEIEQHITHAISLLRAKSIEEAIEKVNSITTDQKFIAR